MDHEAPLRPTVIRTTIHAALAVALTDVQSVVVLLALQGLVAVTKAPLVCLSWCETCRRISQLKS